MKANLILKKIGINILLSCFFSLLISPSSSCFAQKFDGIKELASKNDFQKLPEGAKQVWQTQINDEEIDQIIPFSENFVLLKTIHIKDYNVDYNYSNVSLINMENGSSVWTFSTIDLPQKNQNIITKTPVILIYAVSDKKDEKSGFYAISPSDGKLLWNHDLTNNATYTISDDSKSVYIIIKEEGRFTIENISLDNGQLIWKSNTAIVSDKNMSFPSLSSGKDLYVIAGETIIALNKTSGKLTWQNTLKTDILSSFQSDRSLWLYSYHKAVSLDLNSGKIQNEFLIPEKYISLITVCDEVLIASVYDSTKHVQEIQCYDIINRKLNWTLLVESTLKSAIYYDYDNLSFTTEKAFYKTNINSGAVIANILLADSIKVKSWTFDIIVKSDEKYLVARENSIFIISEKEKIPKLYIPFGIAGGFTPTYMQNKLNEMRIASMIVPENIKLASNITNIYTDKTFNNLARQNQSWVNISTASTLASNSNASQSEKISALDRRELAASGVNSSGKMAAKSQLVGAYGQFGKATGNLLATISLNITKKAFEHILDYMEEKIKVSLSYQSECINGNFYIRPYFENGWRLAIIDINNLSYSSIPMVPDLPPLRYSYTGSVVYSALSIADKQYLLVKGLKSLPAEETATYKFRYGDMDNSRLYDWTLPKPSLICYDITNIKPDNKVPPHNSAMLNASALDFELIQRAFYNDNDKVAELIKNGANINATDEFGHTALMHACQILNTEIVKILLQAGANPNIEDPEGLDAYDYVSMEFPNNIKDAANIFNQLKKAKDNFK